MSVAFYWCHTAGCPNYGRARKMPTADTTCTYCYQQMQLAAPGELPAVTHEVDEENQGRLMEDGD